MNDMLKVFVKDEPWLDSVSVFILAGGPSRHVMRFVDAQEKWEAYEEFSDEPEPTLRLRRDTWDAIVRVAGQHTQSSDATVEALRDTRSVRDRLLTLIEEGWKP